EREPRLASRVACVPLSTFFQKVHEEHGVRFTLCARVQGIEDTGRGSMTVRLAGGQRIEADVVLAGIGALPNDTLAIEAGLDCADGVVVDEAARTSGRDIYAIGDLTRRPVAGYEGLFRLESVPNALEQARQAAASIVERDAPPPEVPWFWSDQYDLKLQIAGLVCDADTTVLRGEPGQGSFAVFHLRGDRVRAVEAVNAAPE